jgi:hypothetical protein
MLNFLKIAMEKLMFYYEFILAPIAFECVGLFLQAYNAQNWWNMRNVPFRLLVNVSIFNISKLRVP